MRRISDFIVLATQIVLGFVFLHFAGPFTSNSFILTFAPLTIVAAICIAFKALFDLRKSFAVAPAPTTNSKLVTVGIYSYIRHPMYSSILLACIGYLLMRFSFEMLVAYLAIVIFFTLKIKY